MAHQSFSQFSKRPSPSGSDSRSSSSRRSTSNTTTDSAALRYFTAAATSSIPYESPYAQNIDRPSQRPSETNIRASNINASARSSSVAPSLIAPSQVRASLSPHSSSSGGSLYTSSPAPQHQRQGTPSMMSSRTMSLVSRTLYLSFLSNYCGLQSTFTALVYPFMFYI